MWDGANPFGIMKPEFDPELISAYLDGELTSQADRERVQQHLAESPADVQMLDDFREMGALLRNLPRESTPPGLLEAVHSQIERETLLSKPQKQQKFSIRRSRFVPMIASASLLMLISTVGTFFYMSNRMSTSSGNAELAMLEDPAREFAHDSESIELKLSDNSKSGISYKLGAAKQKSLAFMKDHEGETSPAAVSKGTVIAKRKMAKEMSRAVRAAAPKELAAAKPAPVSAAGTTEEIPALPALLSKKSIHYLNTLASSPKLQGILEPGELVRYVTSNALTQDVSVVELSVVDVEKTFGTVQVLLSNNQIVPASQIYKVEKNSKKESVEQSSSTTDDARPVEKQLNGQGGMIALYVEASQEQVLNSLVQLDELQDVRQVHVGSVPQLDASAYGVEPVVENNVGLQRFEIDRIATDSLVAAAKRNKSGDSSIAGASPNSTTNTDRQTRIPHWRVLAELKETDKKATSDTLSAGNDAFGEKKRLDKRRKSSETKDAPSAPASGVSVASSAGIDSYQVAVRLLPISGDEKKRRKIAADNKNSVAASVTENEKVQKEKIHHARDNRLRLLLILSLNQE